MTLAAVGMTAVGSLLYMAGVAGAQAQEIDPNISALIQGGGPVSVVVGVILWLNKLADRIGDKIVNEIKSVKNDVVDEMKSIEGRQRQSLTDLRTTVERHVEHRP